MQYPACSSLAVDSHTDKVKAKLTQLSDECSGGLLTLSPSTLSMQVGDTARLDVVLTSRTGGLLRGRNFTGRSDGAFVSGLDSTVLATNITTALNEIDVTLDNTAKVKAHLSEEPLPIVNGTAPTRHRSGDVGRRAPQPGTRMRLSLLLLCTGALVGNALGACAQTPPPPRPVQSFDPALVREQQRRVAAFDSAVRAVSTDSLYRLWQAMLTAPDIRAAQLRVDCELTHLSYRYGLAAYYATKRMQDTLWKHADPAAVNRMDRRAEGSSPSITRGTCGPPPPVRAPRWLRGWEAPPLPALPPSPDDTTTADP